jgi:hypothetical protein
MLKPSSHHESNVKIWFTQQSLHILNSMMMNGAFFLT